MDITILIINYNTGTMVVNCLESILRQKNASYEIIVIDNNSHDNSLELLKPYTNSIKLIANENNIGFGKANNLGFNHSRGQYIYLLNPDTKLETECDLYNVICFMNDNQQYGIISTRMIDENGKENYKPHTIYPGERYARTKFNKLPGKLAWVFGASMVIRHELYEKLCGFDEDYFVYGEDVDLCLRARKAGFKIGYFPDVTVTHKGKSSQQTNLKYKSFKWAEDAIHIFFDKAYPLADRQRIVINILYRTWINIILIKMRKIFGLNTKSKNRLVRYQAILDSSKEYLQNIRLSRRSSIE